MHYIVKITFLHGENLFFFLSIKIIQFIFNVLSRGFAEFIVCDSQSARLVVQANIPQNTKVCRPLGVTSFSSGAK